MRGARARFMEEMDRRDEAGVEIKASKGRRAVGTLFQKRSTQFAGSPKKEQQRWVGEGLQQTPVKVMTKEEELLMQRRRYIAVPEKRQTMRQGKGVY